jgi:allantoicase
MRDAQAQRRGLLLVVVRIDVASSTVKGVKVDTAFFSANHAPAISVKGCLSQHDNKVAS